MATLGEIWEIEKIKMAIKNDQLQRIFLNSIYPVWFLLYFQSEDWIIAKNLSGWIKKTF